jgi:hypothetical protein
MSDLTLSQFLHTRPEEDTTHYGIAFDDPVPEFRDYWFGKSSLQLFTYLCMLVTGGSKQSAPLTTVDRSLATCLNPRGYFSYSLGEVLKQQEKPVLEAILYRSVGTLLFAPVYNLQKAVQRPRIWSLSFVSRLENGKWGLYAQAMMGHCSVWPILPYEIIGTVALCKIISEKSKVPLKGLQWIFHSLTVPAVLQDDWADPDPSQAPSGLPSESEANALLAAEHKLRRDPYARPILICPIGSYCTKYLDNLQNEYITNIGRLVQ